MPELTQKQWQSDLGSSIRTTYLWCMRIENDLIDTIRIVNNTENLQRADGLYVRFPFEPIPPAQTAQRPPEFKVRVDIVDQRVMRALRELRGLKGDTRIVLERVSAEAPDNINWGPAKYKFLDFKTDGVAVGTITGSFLKGALNDAYPFQRFSPANAGPA